MLFGDPRLPQEFWEKCTLGSDGCWLWYTIDKRGACRFQYPHRSVSARVFAYANLICPVVSLRRRCESATCVNPEHHYVSRPGTPKWWYKPYYKTHRRHSPAKPSPRHVDVEAELRKARRDSGDRCDSIFSSGIGSREGTLCR